MGGDWEGLDYQRKASTMTIGLALFGQAFGTYSIGQLAIFIAIVIGIVALLYILSRAVGVAIPPWIIQIGWVLLALVLVIGAIRIVMSM